MAARNRPQLFVSYARADDEPFVLRLVADLRKRGIGVWWDRDTMASRGRSFLQELRDAIWNADRVLAVVGPAALRSPYVRAEWEHALLFCRAVVPVLRQGEPGSFPGDLERRAARLLPRLHMSDFRNDADYADSLGKLVRLLRTPIPAAAALHGVPALPPHFLPRLEAIEALEDDLLADAVAPRVLGAGGRVAAMVGQGGSGKSVVAAALCRDNLARRAFADGIVWLGVGQQVDALTTLNRLGGLLDERFKPGADTAQARDRVEKWLEDRVVLIVLDDVWQLAQVEPVAAALGARGRLLLSTRDAALATALGARVHPLAPLAPAQALQLLASWTGHEAAELPAESKQVAQACGQLPLALAVCGGMAATGTPWADIVDALRCADLAFLGIELPQYPHRDLFKALAVGVDALARADADAAQRYRCLAVLPRDEAVPEAAIERLWGASLSPRQSRQLVTRLASQALLQLQVDGAKRRVSLHALQHDYLLALQPDLVALHRQLVDAYETACGGRWAAAEDDGYVLRHLVRHLHGAGRQGEVDRLLVDPDWLVARCLATDIGSMLADYRCASPDHRAAAALADALRLAAYVVAQDRSLLIGQLIGRLLVSSEPEVVLLVQRLAAWRGRPWLRPATASCLIAAGGALERILTRGSHYVSVIAVGADSSTAVTASTFGKDLLVWDLARGELVRTLIGARQHEVMELTHRRGPADAVAISPDGSHAVSALARPELTLWDLQAGRAVNTFAGHRDNVNAVVWRADGRITSVDRSGEVLVWDPQTLQVLERHAANASWIVAPDGRRVVTVKGDVFDVDQGVVAFRLERLALSSTTRAAISADGRRLLAIDHDGHAKWWDFGTGAMLGEVPQLTPQPHGVALSRDGSQAVICWGAAAALWDLGQSAPKTLLWAHVERCNVVAMTPDETRLLTAAQEIALWDLARIRREAGSLEWPDSLMQVAVSRDHVAGGTWGGDLVVWDRRSGVELCRAAYPTGRKVDGIDAVAISDDGTQVLVSIGEGLVAVRDLNDWNQERRFERGYTAALLPGSRRVASFGQPTLRDLVVWDFETGEVACCVTGYEHFRPHAFTPDGRKAAWIGDRDRLQIVDLDQGRLLHDLDGRGISLLAAAPDSRRLVVGDSRAATLRVIDLDSGATVASVAHDVPNDAGAVAASHDGRVLLAATDQGLVRAWSLPEGRPLYDLQPHDSFVGYVGVSADERFAVSCGNYDGVVQVWDLRSGAKVARFVAESYFTHPCLAPDAFTLVSTGMGVPMVLELEGCVPAGG